MNDFILPLIGLLLTATSVFGTLVFMQQKTASDNKKNDADVKKDNADTQLQYSQRVETLEHDKELLRKDLILEQARSARTEEKAMRLQTEVDFLRNMVNDLYKRCTMLEAHLNVNVNMGDKSSMTMNSADMTIMGVAALPLYQMPSSIVAPASTPTSVPQLDLQQQSSKIAPPSNGITSGTPVSPVIDPPANG